MTMATARREVGWMVMEPTGRAAYSYNENRVVYGDPTAAKAAAQRLGKPGYKAVEIRTVKEHWFKDSRNE